jgi:hypothetical protein
MPITVQHLVHEPQDFPGAMDGFAIAFQSSPKYSDAAWTGVPARPDLRNGDLAGPEHLYLQLLKPPGNAGFVASLLALVAASSAKTMGFCVPGSYRSGAPEEIRALDSQIPILATAIFKPGRALPIFPP